MKDYNKEIVNEMKITAVKLVGTLGGQKAELLMDKDVFNEWLKKRGEKVI